MKFSVLIPVYNTEKYLEECLQSVLNQTYQDFEIVLVDDGSTDSSGIICDRYRASYSKNVKVIHKDNQGQLASRCNAINNSVGEYCIFVDADDLLVNNALEVISKKISQYENPDLLIYSFYYESEDGSCRKADKLFDEGFVPIDKVYQMFFTGTGLNNVWTKAIKREKALNTDFVFEEFYHLRCSEDKLHSMVMVDGCQSIVYIYEHLYRYRLFEGSVTRNYSPENIEKFNTANIYDTEKNFLKKWNLPLPEWQLRMDAQCVSTTIFVFSLFYNNAKGAEKKKVVQYNWSTFLCIESINNLQNNPYLNEAHKQLLVWILNQDYAVIKKYFLKKNLRKKLKKSRGKSTVI